MAIATVVVLAQAVVAELQAGTYSQPCDVVRAYAPVATLQELTTARVTVIPKRCDSELQSRAALRDEYAVDIAVQRKVDPADLAEIDALLLLTEELRDFLKGRALAACPEAQWLATANDPLYAPEHLAQQHAFTSLLTLTYHVWR